MHPWFHAALAPVVCRHTPLRLWQDGDGTSATTDSLRLTTAEGSPGSGPQRRAGVYPDQELGAAQRQGGSAGPKAEGQGVGVVSQAEGVPQPVDHFLHRPPQKQSLVGRVVVELFVQPFRVHRNETSA